VVDVAEPEGFAAAHALWQLRQPGRHVRQIDQRHDRAVDDVPVADRERNHRLDVQDVRRVVARADAEQGVVLERQADHCGDRILRCLGEIAGLLRERRRNGRQGHEQRKRESRSATEHGDSD
jgi:hypothetical protein